MSRLAPPGSAKASASASLDHNGRPGFGLFWRTFFLIAMLLLGSTLAWVQSFRLLEFEPRALQSAQQLATLVNLSRAALVHADAVARISLVKTLVDEEDVRIASRDPKDVYEPFDTDTLSRNISQSLRERLGADTIVARTVNGFEGLWVGFNIKDDAYWLLTDPARINHLNRVTWLVWSVTAALLSLVGAALIARRLNQPLKDLAQAAVRLREGDLQTTTLSEDNPTPEIRQVNLAFNRMVQRLRQIESDRSLMLAGISHDLRTPLARLRLETEMAVPDLATRQLMAGDIEQVNGIIDKFMDYARNQDLRPTPVRLAASLEAALSGLSALPGLRVHHHIPANLWVMGDLVELQRVWVNLLENAHRYGQQGQQALVEVEASEANGQVQCTVRDHGRGVDPAQLKHLTQPFFRGEQARSNTTGTGLGLAIVLRTLARMGGELRLFNHPQGGLAAQLLLRAAKAPPPVPPSPAPGPLGPVFRPSWPSR